MSRQGFLSDVLSAEAIFDLTAPPAARPPNYEKLAQDAAEQIEAAGHIVPAAQALLPKTLPWAWRENDRFQNGARYVNRARGLVAILTVGIHAGKLWGHFSLSAKERTPSYRELCEAKATFLGEERRALQVFAPKNEHVNLHPYCLHLWTALEGDGLPDFTNGTGSI